MTELSPPPPREVPPVALVAMRRRILARERRRIPTRRLVIACAAALAIGAGATAYAFFASGGERLTNAVVCHNEPKLAGSVTGILGADGREPIDICAAHMWNKAAPAPLWMRAAAPPLVACADREHGEIDVFPAADERICDRLGLSSVPADYRREAARYSVMIQDLDRAVRDVCLGDAEARAVARKVLDRHGYQDWTPETPGSGPGRPCRNSLSSHPERKAIILVAGPRNP
jgi:hypothetical protein